MWECACACAQDGVWAQQRATCPCWFLIEIHSDPESVVQSGWARLPRCSLPSPCQDSPAKAGEWVRSSHSGCICQVVPGSGLQLGALPLCPESLLQRRAC